MSSVQRMEEHLLTSPFSGSPRSLVNNFIYSQMAEKYKEINFSSKNIDIK